MNSNTSKPKPQRDEEAPAKKPEQNKFDWSKGDISPAPISEETAKLLAARNEAAKK